MISEQSFEPTQAHADNQKQDLIFLVWLKPIEPDFNSRQPKATMTSPASFPTYPDLAGKVALITGIGQVGHPNTTTWGNGAATARLLTHNNVRIFGCDLNLTAA